MIDCTDALPGDMHNRQGLSLGMFWECLTDWHMWPIYLIGLSWLLPNNPITGMSPPHATTIQAN
jgi:hypothetical protein